MLGRFVVIGSSVLDDHVRLKPRAHTRLATVPRRRDRRPEQEANRESGSESYPKL
jgi:hypothetical protein